MFGFFRDLSLLAALASLFIWSIAPIALLPFGFMALGFGVGALVMNAFDDDYILPVTQGYRTGPTVLVSQQPTYVGPSPWNPFNWFPTWSMGSNHYGAHTHSHPIGSSYSIPTRQHQRETIVPAPTHHYGSLYTGPTTAAAASSHSSYSHNNHHHHR